MFRKKTKRLDKGKDGRIQDGMAGVVVNKQTEGAELMGKILVTFSNFEKNCPDAYQRLRREGFQFQLSENDVPFCTRKQLMESIGDVDVVVAGLDTLDAALFAAAPHLKLVARMGVGYDRIDLKSAKEHGIAVTNTRGNNALAVAEQCLGMMLAVYRNLNDLDRCLHRGRWVRYVGRELTGKVVGLVGFGDIAQRLAKLLKGFDVQILACRKSGLPSERAEALGVTLTSLDVVLQNSDIVSLHLPGDPENEGIIGAAQLAAMKPGAILINTSRGCLLDSGALLASIREGHLAGAAVDVYPSEPPDPSDPLLQDPRILCTPHSSSETEESYRSGGDMILRQILAVYAGKPPENWLNP